MASREEISRLVVEHLPRMKRFALSLTKNRDEAEEVVQDTIIRVLEKSHTWESGTDFGAWMGTVLFSRHQQRIRKRVRRGIELEADDSVLSPVPATQMVGMIVRDMVAEFATLPKNIRHVLLRQARDGWEYEKIARESGLPLGTVRSQLFRSREKMRTAMAIKNLEVTTEDSDDEFGAFDPGLFTLLVDGLDQTPGSLRAVRNYLEMGLTELANQTGISVRKLQSWEGGSRKPTPETVSLLRDILRTCVAIRR